MRYKRERGTKIIPNHALDKIRNSSEAYFPPPGPSLTSYALEYGGALRMIRVFVFSNDLNAICPREGVGVGIYRLKRQS